MGKIDAGNSPAPRRYCTGKDGISGCAAIGAEGTETEAAVMDRVIEIPSEPVIASSTTSNDTTRPAAAEPRTPAPASLVAGTHVDKKAGTSPPRNKRLHATGTTPTIDGDP